MKTPSKEAIESARRIMAYSNLPWAEPNIAEIIQAAIDAAVLQAKADMVREYLAESRPAQDENEPPHNLIQATYELDAWFVKHGSNQWEAGAAKSRRESRSAQEICPNCGRPLNECCGNCIFPKDLSQPSGEKQLPTKASDSSQDAPRHTLD